MAWGRAEANRDIRLEARGAGVPLRKIAAAQDISEQMLHKRWRKELSGEAKAEVRKIIARLRETA